MEKIKELFKMDREKNTPNLFAKVKEFLVTTNFLQQLSEEITKERTREVKRGVYKKARIEISNENLLNFLFSSEDIKELNSNSIYLQEAEADGILITFDRRTGLGRLFSSVCLYFSKDTNPKEFYENQFLSSYFIDLEVDLNTFTIIESGSRCYRDFHWTEKYSSVRLFSRQSGELKYLVELCYSPSTDSIFDMSERTEQLFTRKHSGELDKKASLLDIPFDDLLNRVSNKLSKIFVESIDSFKGLKFYIEHYGLFIIDFFDPDSKVITTCEEAFLLIAYLDLIFACDKRGQSTRWFTNQGYDPDEVIRLYYPEYITNEKDRFHSYFNLYAIRQIPQDQRVNFVTSVIKFFEEVNKSYVANLEKDFEQLSPAIKCFSEFIKNMKNVLDSNPRLRNDPSYWDLHKYMNIVGFNSEEDRSIAKEAIDLVGYQLFHSDYDLYLDPRSSRWSFYYSHILHDYKQKIRMKEINEGKLELGS